MTHRKATVGMIGACMLVMALVLATGAWANEFFDAGTADQIDGADNFGKTFIHYAVVMGLPTLSLGLMAGGLMRLKAHPGQGGAGLAAGGAAGYAAAIVKGLHTDAAAAVSLASLPSAAPWASVGLDVVLLAALVAYTVCLVRGRTGRMRSDGCATGAAASLMSR